MAPPTGRGVYGYGGRSYSGYPNDSGFSDGDTSSLHTGRRDNMSRGGHDRQGRQSRQPSVHRYPDDGYSSSDGYGSSALRDRAKMRDEIKHLKAQVNKLQEDEKRHVKVLDETIADLRGRNKALDYENKGLRDANRALDDGSRALEARVEFLEGQNQSLKGQNQSLKVQLRDLEGEFGPLKEENKGLKDSNRILSKNTRTSEHEYNSLRDRVDHLQTELGHYRQLVKSTEKKLQDEKHAAADRRRLYDANIKDVERERDNNLRAYNASEGNRATLQQANHALEENLTAERARLAILQTTNQSLRGEAATLNTNLNAQIRQLGEENQNLRYRSHLLNQQFERTRQELDEATRSLREKEEALENVYTARQGYRRGNTTVRQRANGRLESFRPHERE